MFSVVISLLLVPLLTGWTFGQGFLQVLYMDDQGGCLSLHLASGMAAMMACYVIKERTGRFEPISIKRNFEDEDQNIFLSTNQIENEQEQLNRIASSIGINFSKQHK